MADYLRVADYGHGPDVEVCQRIFYRKGFGLRVVRLGGAPHVPEPAGYGVQQGGLTGCPRRSA